LRKSKIIVYAQNVQVQLLCCCSSIYFHLIPLQGSPNFRPAFNFSCSLSTSSRPWIVTLLFTNVRSCRYMCALLLWANLANLRCVYYIYTYIDVYVYIYMYIYIYVYICIYICVYIYMCVCTYDNIPYIYIRACTYFNIPCIYVCVCVHIIIVKQGVEPRTQQNKESQSAEPCMKYQMPPFTSGHLSHRVDDIELTRTLVVVRVRGN